MKHLQNIYTGTFIVYLQTLHTVTRTRGLKKKKRIVQFPVYHSYPFSLLYWNRTHVLLAMLWHLSYNSFHMVVFRVSLFCCEAHSDIQYPWHKSCPLCSLSRTFHQHYVKCLMHISTHVHHLDSPWRSQSLWQFLKS